MIWVKVGIEPDGSESSAVGFIQEMCQLQRLVVAHWTSDSCRLTLTETRSDCDCLTHHMQKSGVEIAFFHLALADLFRIV